MAGWRPSVHGWFDSAATASSSASSSATVRANAEIMSTHIDLVGSPIEWGATLTPSGARRVRTLLVRYGSADNPCELGETAQHVCGCCPPYWECVRTLAPGLFVLRAEGARAWARPEGITVKRKLSLLLPGSVSIMGCRFGDVTHRANHCATHVDRSCECSHKCWEWKYTDLGFLALAETPRCHSAAVPQDGHDEERNRDGINLETRSRNSVPSITATGTARSIVASTV